MGKGGTWVVGGGGTGRVRGILWVKQEPGNREGHRMYRGECQVVYSYVA